MNKSQKQVREFHKAFNHPIADKPTLLSFKRKNFRYDLMKEELDEFMGAIGCPPNVLIDEIDALIDLLYFTYGTLVEMGIDAEEMFDIVQECNMNKLGPDGKPIYRDDGKVLKPDGWVGPEEKIKNLLALKWDQYFTSNYFKKEYANGYSDGYDDGYRHRKYEESE